MKNKIIQFYKKKMFAINVFGGVLLLNLILVCIATRGFADLEPGTYYNKVAIAIGDVSIAWYAIFVIAGIGSASAIGIYEFKVHGIKIDDLWDGLLLCVPIAIIGARLYYVIFDANGTYKSFIDVIDFTRGGLAIHGAIISTFITIFFFTKYKKINFFGVVDIVAPCFLVGQLLGRWCNFMNAEAHGPFIESEVILNILPDFIKSQYSVWSYDNTGAFALVGVYHPTFLYEALWNLVGFIGLAIIRRFKVLKIGDMLGIYLIWYGLGRGLIIEPLRTDPLYIFGLRANIVLSLSLFTGGGLLYIVFKRLYFSLYKKEPQIFYADFMMPSDYDIVRDKERKQKKLAQKAESNEDKKE